MIITDRFVMLNFQKTGSSFARAMLKSIHNYDQGMFKPFLHRAIRKFEYGTMPNELLRWMDTVVSPDMTELIVPKRPLERLPDYRQSQHGTYSQIPEEHRGKTIVSIVRNPFARYVSAYLYAGWKRTHLEAYGDQLGARFPDFPDLSFADYYELVHFYIQDLRLQDAVPKIDLGVNTIQFIQFYFKEPDRVLDKIDEAYLVSGAYWDDMPEVVFLHQENLNQELRDFLLSQGYASESLQFMLDAERVRVSPRASHQHTMVDFYTEELVEQVFERDRLLFSRFPEYKYSPLQVDEPV